jgi:DNA-binding transcriptional MerR regulator
MGDTQRTFSASAAAALSGVSKDTLRHYERVGVLAAPARSASGYRLYSQGHIERVRLVRSAIAVGFGLQELTEFLQARDEGGTPCRKVRQSLGRKKDELDRKLEEIQLMRDQLERILSDWDAKICQVPLGDQAGLLESLPPPPRKPK